jgi:hypothetical protein
MSKAAELASLASASETALSNRNIAYNGAMQVSQRATSATGLGGATSYPTCDRWNLQGGTAGRLTMTQTADGPSGFANCIKLDCTTADTSVAADEYLILRQLFEGQDLQRIKKGTSAAEQITVSFYVKASGAFNFILELFDRDNTRGVSKLYATTTDWVRHEITFPADTTGAFGDDNANSMDLAFWLHAGSNYTSGTLQTSWVSNTNANRAAGISSFVSSTDNEFFITGVQMEVGPVATPFEDRSYGQELALCQRYYQTINPKINAIFAAGYQNNSERISQVHRLGIEMRTEPTCTVSGTWTVSGCDQPVFTSFSKNVVSTHILKSGGSAGSAYYHANGTDDFFSMDAEL